MFNNTAIIKIMTETTTIVSAVGSILDEGPTGAVYLRRPGRLAECLSDCRGAETRIPQALIGAL